PLRGPRLDPSSLKRMSDEIGAAVDQAVSGGSDGEPEPKGTTDDSENPLAKKEPAPKPEAVPEAAIERPEWAPYFDASVGLLLTVTYSYLAIGLGGHWMFAKAVGAYLQFNVLLPFSTGDLQSPQEFGPGGAIGLRPSLGVEVKPWNGLTARVGGFLEYYSLSF